MNINQPLAVTPAFDARLIQPYGVPHPPGETDLFLDANEGVMPPAELIEALGEVTVEDLRRYAAPRRLEARVAERLGVGADQVIVTAGGDDALDRCCRAVLGPGREIILPVPTFEMLERYARLSGGDVVEIEWNTERYPIDDVLAAITDRTAAIAVVTPNNPTGAVATADDLRRLSQAAPGALLIVDLAYTEFADENLTDVARSLPNAVIVRTFSKCSGLAGLRVGYAAGPAEIITWLRSMGHPYPIASIASLLAERALDVEDARQRRYLEQVRRERGELFVLLQELNAQPMRSQGNFVLARFDEGMTPGALEVQRRLAERGIRVRAFPDQPRLVDALRITCPGDPVGFEQLREGLRAAISPPASPWVGREGGDDDQITLDESSVEGKTGVETHPPAPSLGGRGSDLRPPAKGGRGSRVTRRTSETDIAVELNLDGAGAASVDTGLGFLDHMLTALAAHGGFDLTLRCAGDTHVDDHHTAEDCALALGQAINEALGDRCGIRRFGWALAPMDEALARCAIDLSGRPAASVDLPFTREMLGDVATENLSHFVQSLAQSARCAIHLDLLRGENDHHRSEAAFKALALAMRRACARSERVDLVPSTKGVL